MVNGKGKYAAERGFIVSSIVSDFEEMNTVLRIALVCIHSIYTTVSTTDKTVCMITENAAQIVSR